MAAGGATLGTLTGSAGVVVLGMVVTTATPRSGPWPRSLCPEAPATPKIGTPISAAAAATEKTLLARAAIHERFKDICKSLYIFPYDSTMIVSAQS